MNLGLNLTLIITEHNKYLLEAYIEMGIVDIRKDSKIDS